MAQTKRDFVLEVAQKLGVAPGHQAPSGTDYAAIEAKVLRIFDQLEAREIYRVDNPDAIEDAAFDLLAMIVAEHCKDAFEGMGAMSADALRYAEDRLKQISNIGRFVSKRLKIDSGLTARGVR